MPSEFFLSQNYPNPFNPSTTIRFSIPKQGKASLKIYNILGQEVETVVDDVLPAGSHSIRWEGTSNSNRQVATGVYFYRLESGGFVATRKLLLLR
jgi:flagellar hook assembly protein FlgD